MGRLSHKRTSEPEEYLLPNALVLFKLVRIEHAGPNQGTTNGGCKRAVPRQCREPVSVLGVAGPKSLARKSRGSLLCQITERDCQQSRKQQSRSPQLEFEIRLAIRAISDQ